VGDSYNPKIIERQDLKKGSFNHDPKAQFRARELRNEMSVSEQVLWSAIRKERTGYAFRRQVRVGPYYLDFYCAKAKLCIEVDGEQHQTMVQRDARRDATLKDLGIETLRIPSLELFDEKGAGLSAWIRRITNLCESRARKVSHPLTPPSKTNHFEGGE